MQAGIKIDFREPHHVAENSVGGAVAALPPDKNRIRRFRPEIGVEPRQFARNGALKQRDLKTVVTDAKRGVKEKVANTGEKKGARCRRRGVNEDRY